MPSSSPRPTIWHKQMLVDAVAAGKDVYVEKSVTHAVEEGPRNRGRGKERSYGADRHPNAELAPLPPGKADC